MAFGHVPVNSWFGLLIARSFVFGLQITDGVEEEMIDESEMIAESSPAITLDLFHINATHYCTTHSTKVET